MSDSIIHVSKDLRPEAKREHAYNALRRRFPSLLMLAYEKGLMTEIVIQQGGQPRVLTVEPEQEN